jgi:hypothetical protein
MTIDERIQRLEKTVLPKGKQPGTQLSRQLCDNEMLQRQGMVPGADPAAATIVWSLYVTGMNQPGFYSFLGLTIEEVIQKAEKCLL